MRPESEAWFDHRTWQRPSWTVSDLKAAKRERRISIVLPALNEQHTIGEIVSKLTRFTRGVDPLVDELVAFDSGSTDDTRLVATRAGARVVGHEEVLAGIQPRGGKGEVLWRSLAATSGDIVMFIDSDLVDFDPCFVPALLGPILTKPNIALVKGFYHRPLRCTSGSPDSGGGRVTELMARPLLSALRPELSGFVQPLGGEYVATRNFLESVPFAAGYGVEIGLLLDAHSRLGLDALAQVNLGVRNHRNRPVRELGVMARQILATALRRCSLPDSGDPITQFVPFGDEWGPITLSVETAERPPMREVLSSSFD